MVLVLALKKNKYFNAVGGDNAGVEATREHNGIRTAVN
jgi:hypothetical protein